MDNTSVVNHYFKLFENKNLTALCLLFDDNITLRDWEVEANGLVEVKKAFNSIFKTKDKISVKVHEMFEVNHTLIADIEITIGKMIELKVVDIIKFNKDQKIVSIRGFKG